MTCKELVKKNSERAFPPAVTLYVKIQNLFRTSYRRSVAYNLDLTTDALPLAQHLTLAWVLRGNSEPESTANQSIFFFFLLK